MMAQYLSLKAEAEDCLLFYRMGDFFELFFDDARVAAACLDIALTARGEHDGEKIPMCGVPAHAAEGYLARLIKAGHRVAIADQTESPAEAKKRGGSKALVSRGIVRVVTAGTLTEEALLDSRSSNWCASVGEAAGHVAIAAADISTGRFDIIESSAGGLAADLEVRTGCIGTVATRFVRNAARARGDVPRREIHHPGIRVEHPKWLRIINAVLSCRPEQWNAERIPGAVRPRPISSQLLPWGGMGNAEGDIGVVDAHRAAVLADIRGPVGRVQAREPRSAVR